MSNCIGQEDFSSFSHQHYFLLHLFLLLKHLSASAQRSFAHQRALSMTQWHLLDQKRFVDNMKHPTHIFELESNPEGWNFLQFFPLNFFDIFLLQSFWLGLPKMWYFFKTWTKVQTMTHFFESCDTKSFLNYTEIFFWNWDTSI